MAYEWWGIVSSITSFVKSIFGWCTRFSENVLSLDPPKDVRDVVKSFFEDKKLGGVLRNEINQNGLDNLYESLKGASKAIVRMPTNDVVGANDPQKTSNSNSESPSTQSQNASPESSHLLSRDPRGQVPRKGFLTVSDCMRMFPLRQADRRLLQSYDDEKGMDWLMIETSNVITCAREFLKSLFAFRVNKYYYDTSRTYNSLGPNTHYAIDIFVRSDAAMIIDKACKTVVFISADLSSVEDETTELPLPADFQFHYVLLTYHRSSCRIAGKKTALHVFQHVAPADNKKNHTLELMLSAKEYAKQLEFSLPDFTIRMDALSSF